MMKKVRDIRVIVRRLFWGGLGLIINGVAFMLVRLIRMINSYNQMKLLIS